MAPGIHNMALTTICRSLPMWTIFSKSLIFSPLLSLFFSPHSLIHPANQGPHSQLRHLARELEGGHGGDGPSVAVRFQDTSDGVEAVAEIELPAVGVGIQGLQNLRRGGSSRGWVEGGRNGANEVSIYNTNLQYVYSIFIVRVSAVSTLIYKCRIHCTCHN